MKLQIKLRGYLLLLIFSSFLHCTSYQKNQTGKLKITLSYCKYDNKDLFLKKATIYKGKTEFKEVDFEHRENYIIPKLPFGKYTIKYKSIFNILESINFVINDQKEKQVTLCVDKINYSDNKNTLLLDELKTGESLEFLFTSVGCFDMHQGKLTITRIDTKKYKATINGFEFVVTDEQYRSIREFEIELRCNHTSDCTTVDTYKVINKNSLKSYSIKDGSCRWRGFDNLIEKLNIKEKLLHQNDEI
ncbi:MAG TPA: hypothetical protein ENK46_05675 [Flavobacteriia bacterium]|nr:hypothetical protein [Flavobacteriia bacterium]